MSFITPRQSELAREIAVHLAAANEKLAVAESSSGGLVSACLLSVPGASSFFIGGAVLYSYRIREQIVALGRKEHQRYGGSTPELILDIALKFKEKTGADWVIGEGGAAGPSQSPYGHNAGYTALAVAGPICRTKIIETGKSARIGNMSEFTTALLDFFLSILEERNTLKK
ncbi:MAG: CinA family protein [Deltaproteobacteria bacterium]|nr:CinA family protein [Deltaproteobacteria bacterium]